MDNIASVAAPARTSRYRTVPGLFDLRLQPGGEGGLALPHRPGAELGAGPLADLLVDSGAAGDDIRVLLNGGARWADLFADVAGRLGHDVLITPAGTRLTERAGRGGPGAAVPVDSTGAPVDWLLVQPPALATPLPGWFEQWGGEIRPRTGIVTVPLRGGVALATRADFTTRRAAAARLAGTGDPALVTIAVTVRSGWFQIGDYGGGQALYDARGLAAALAELSLYEAQLRLWLAWPADRGEQHRLAANLVDLAAFTGATVWAPVAGGRAEVVADHTDLAAYDASGQPAAWQEYRPAERPMPELFQSDVDGCLVSVHAAPRPTVALAPGALVPVPAPVAAPSLLAPAVTVAEHSRPSGVDWLPERLPVNAEPFELYVTAPLPPAEAATAGVPSAQLYLVGHLSPDPATPRGGEHLLRVRVQPGGAVRLSALDGRVPPHIQHLVGVTDAYLLPAGWLDRASLEPAGDGRDPTEDAPLYLRCQGARHGVAGLPSEVRRWPARRARAYALLPDAAPMPPDGPLRLYRRPPPVKPGHRLLRLRVPRRGAIDVGGTAERLEPLCSIRSRAAELRGGGTTLLLPRRWFDQVILERVLVPGQRRWRRGRRLGRPLSAADKPRR
jgi:hypothetical protein